MTRNVVNIRINVLVAVALTTILSISSSKAAAQNFVPVPSSINPQERNVNVVSGAVTATHVLVAAEFLYAWDLSDQSRQTLLYGSEAIDISGDGSSVVRAHPLDSSVSYSQTIEVRSVDFDQYTQVGGTLTVPETGNSVQEVTINYDGTVIGYSHYSNGGVVRVYELIGSEWSQKGSDLRYENSTLFGYQLDLDSAGDRLFVMSRYHLSVYDWNGTEWVQVGDIFTTSSGGVSDLQITPDGNTVAIAGDDAEDRGLVSVWDYNASLTGKWGLRGSEIVGDTPGIRARYIGLAPSGNILAVNTNIYTYNYTEDEWELTGSNSKGNGAQPLVTMLAKDLIYNSGTLSSIDTDGDGRTNPFDIDDDGDGVEDASDAFPLDATETLDTDSDGIGNNDDIDSAVATVTDSALQACIIETGAQRVSEVTGLTCDYRDIVSLSGLDAFSALLELNIPGNPIDWSTLPTIANLERLYVNTSTLTMLTDLSPVAGTLTALDVSWNQLTTLEGIGLFEQNQSFAINAAYNVINDISAFDESPMLFVGLTLGGNLISDISPLAHYSNANQGGIELWDNPIRRLGGTLNSWSDLRVNFERTELSCEEIADAQAVIDESLIVTWPDPCFSDPDRDYFYEGEDAFPIDPAASVDSDGDGAPDAWNENASEEQIEASSLLLDAFPLDPAASVDSDGDGYPDEWNENATQEQIESSELSLDAFSEYPNEWADSDGDGYGDNLDGWCLDFNDENTPNKIWLNSQTKINEFQAVSGPCYRYAGSVYVSGENSPEDDQIQDLTPLSTLTTANWFMLIRTPLITALPEMQLRDSGIGIYETNLTSLDGLQSLRSLGNHDVFVMFNPLLEDLTALSGVEPAEGISLLVFGNSVLSNLDGLEFVSGASRGIAIVDNERLVDLKGLSNVTSVRYDFRIRGNDTLENLSGLERVRSVNNDFSYSEFGVFDNQRLVDCSALAVALGYPTRPWNSDLDNVDGPFLIQGNAEGANSPDDCLDLYALKNEDSDGDGVNDYYDDLPNNPAASVDTDGDGYPDEWNEDATEEEIANSSVSLDAFPDDPTASEDTDGDGYPDQWNENATAQQIAESSLTLDAFPEDRYEWLDTDGDGIGNHTDIDDDGDGSSDAEEIAEGTDSLDANDYPGSGGLNILLIKAAMDAAAEARL